MSDFADAPSCEHNADYECFDCGTRRHAEQHPTLDHDGCLSCKLTSVRIYGRFTGTGSTSDAVQEFYQTGDPGVFDRQDKTAALSRMKDPLRVG